MAVRNNRRVCARCTVQMSRGGRKCENCGQQVCPRCMKGFTRCPSCLRRHRPEDKKKRKSPYG